MNTSKITNMYFMFQYCSKLKVVNLKSFTTTANTNINGMWNLTNVEKIIIGPGWGAARHVKMVEE